MPQDNVNTLDEQQPDEVKNTDTTLEQEDNTQPDDTESTQTEGEVDKPSDDDIDWDKTIASMDDDQTVTWMESGKLPEGITPVKKSGGEESKDDSSTDTSTTPKDESSKTGDGLLSTKTDSSKEQKPVGSVLPKSTEKATSKGNEGHKQETRSGQVDYKSAYDTIFKGFKANGKDIVPRTVEDVISLMQMGANYTKKMQGIAPLRRTVESLNRAQIGEEELNFLIDIHKGDKEAIKKLLQKHKVDPIDLDMDTTNYVPKDNMVSKSDAEYFEALDDIKSSIPKITEIMDKLWDDESKQMLLKDRNLVQQLHEEIQFGRFDVVQARLEQEKTFGRYKGVSDLDAYKAILQIMVAEYNEAEKQKTTTPGVKPSNTPKQVIPDKKGAAPNKAIKAATQGSGVTPKDILSMSDEDFMKLDVNRLVS